MGPWLSGRKRDPLPLAQAIPGVLGQIYERRQKELYEFLRDVINTNHYTRCGREESLIKGLLEGEIIPGVNPKM